MGLGAGSVDVLLNLCRAGVGTFHGVEDVGAVVEADCHVGLDFSTTPESPGSTQDLIHQSFLENALRIEFDLKGRSESVVDVLFAGADEVAGE